MTILSWLFGTIFGMVLFCHDFVVTIFNTVFFVTDYVVIIFGMVFVTVISTVDVVMDLGMG